MKNLLALLLALFPLDYTVTPARDYSPEPPDLELHPHTADETQGGQNPCDTGVQPSCRVDFACGQIGTTFDLFMHRVRCKGRDPMLPPTVFLQPGTPCWLFIGAGFEEVLTRNGWSLVADVQDVWPTVAFSQGNQGVARWEIDIPNDPSLVGTLVYFQGGALEVSTWRESSFGVLEIIP